MRLLLDITHRNPTWAVLDRWILTLLVQKCIVSSSPGYDTPGDIFRRVIESISSGVLLPGYPGILDPCESGPVDVSSVLTAQQRADITLSAQHYLRLIAFNQLHLVLDTSPPEGYAPYSLGKKDRRISDDGNEGAWDSTATKHFKPMDS
jgi:zinc finger RNA-binding protein